MQYNRKIFKSILTKVRRVIRQYNYEYYILNSPSISDANYDLLFESLKKLENRNYKEEKIGSMTFSVGFNSDKKFSQVMHISPMLSIDNTLKSSGLHNFYKKNNQEVSDIQYNCEAKVDGVAVSLSYEYGYLIYASTRGDGFIGEDVTKNIKYVKNVPKLIFRKNIPKYFEIRGEICISRLVFKEVNQYMLSIGDDAFLNPRNAASGSLRKIGMSREILKLLDFYAYSGIKILSKKNIEQIKKNQSESLKSIKYLGFNSVTQVGTAITLEDCELFYLSTLEKRGYLLFDLDGTVFKMNNFKHQEIFGFSSRAPKWVIAYKFPPEEEITLVCDIELQTGRTGIVTPIAKLKPVFLGGAIVDSVNLHNFLELKKININKEDMVIVRRSGDVVPEIRTIRQKYAIRNKRIKKNCPSCLSKTKTSKNLVIKCSQGFYCRAQLREAINHFSSRKAMNISGLGNKIIEKLINAKIVQDIPDLFYLKVDDLHRVIKIGEKTSRNVILSIENCKFTELHRFLYSLGIKEVGETTAKSIVMHFKNLKAIINAKNSDFLKIKDIGQSIVKNIRCFFTDKHNINLIEQLVDAGITW